MEDEANVLAQYIAAGRPASTPKLLLPQANQAITNIAAVQAESLEAHIGSGYPPQVQAAVTVVDDQVPQIRDLRMLALHSTAPVLGITEAYTLSASMVLSLNDQIAASSGDPALSADVRALDTLSQAENAASEERAILAAVLIRGQWQPREATALSGADAERLAELQEFSSEVPASEYSSYLATVSGPEADTVSSMLQQALTLGPNGAVPVNPPGSGFPTAAQAWDEDMTYTVDQMRGVEQSLLSSIQVRSQALHDQASQTVTDTWVETLGVLFAVLTIAVIAVRRSSPSRRVHWI
jgi:hypothetical protein